MTYGYKWALTGWCETLWGIGLGECLTHDDTSFDTCYDHSFHGFLVGYVMPWYVVVYLLAAILTNFLE